MRTKNKLVSLLALGLAIAAQAAPSASIQARQRSGTVSLPFATKPSTVSSFATSGTVYPDGKAVTYNLVVSATGDAGDGTYRFTVSTLTATAASGVLSGAATVELDNQSPGYAQGQTFTIHYWQTATLKRIKLPTVLGGPSFVDINGPLTAPGYGSWDVPGEYVQSVIGGFGPSVCSWFTTCYYGTPTTGGQVQFRVLEWRVSCSGLTPGTTYYLEYFAVKRPTGSGAGWVGANDTIRTSFVAVSSNDTTAWVGLDYMPRTPGYEYIIYGASIDTNPPIDPQSPPP